MFSLSLHGTVSTSSFPLPSSCGYLLNFAISRDPLYSPDFRVWTVKKMAAPPPSMTMHTQQEMMNRTRYTQKLQWEHRGERTREFGGRREGRAGEEREGRREEEREGGRGGREGGEGGSHFHMCWFSGTRDLHY